MELDAVEGVKIGGTDKKKKEKGRGKGRFSILSRLVRRRGISRGDKEGELRIPTSSNAGKWGFKGWERKKRY